MPIELHTEEIPGRRYQVESDCELGAKPSDKQTAAQLSLCTPRLRPNPKNPAEFHRLSALKVGDFFCLYYPLNWQPLTRTKSRSESSSPVIGQSNFGMIRTPMRIVLYKPARSLSDYHW